MRRGVRSGRLHDLDADVDDDLPVLVIWRPVDRRQDGQVDPERLGSQVAALGDLAGQIRRCGLGERGDEAERTRVGHGGNEFRATDPLHATPARSGARRRTSR